MSTSIKGSTDAPAIYRDTALTSTAVSAHDDSAELTGWNIINPNTSDVYVKFVDTTSGTTTVGTTAVVKTLLVPANSSVYQEHQKGSSQGYFSDALTLYCVTGRADNNTTAPTTAIHAEIYYKQA